MGMTLEMGSASIMSPYQFMPDIKAPSNTMSSSIDLKRYQWILMLSIEEVSQMKMVPNMVMIFLTMFIPFKIRNLRTPAPIMPNEIKS